MARCRPRQPVVMGEALAPQPMRAVELARDAVARPEQTREPYAARMLGQVNHEIVSPCAEREEQIALRSCMGDESPVLGLAIDDVDPRNRRMALEHRRGFGIDQRIDLRLWERALEHREHRRGEQNIAVMPELGNERATDAADIDG